MVAGAGNVPTRALLLAPMLQVALCQPARAQLRRALASGAPRQRHGSGQTTQRTFPPRSHHPSHPEQPSRLKACDSRDININIAPSVT